MKRVRLVVSPTEAHARLDALLTGRGGLDPATFARALAAGGISVNRRRVTRADLPLHLRDEVVATLVEGGRAASGAAPLPPERILHRDPHLIAVDKPPGLPAQGTASDARAGLDEAVRRRLELDREPSFVGLVHRLDLETSGVTVFGRTGPATTALAASFREGAARKTYLCLVAGDPDWAVQEIDAPLDARPGRPGVYEVRNGGKPARTVLEVRARYRGDGFQAALVEARPATGRTHQIRVHAAHAGHPLLGDRRYAGPAFLTRADGQRLECPRVALHAARLELPHPSGGVFQAGCELPDDLRRLSETLQKWTNEG